MATLGWAASAAPAAAHAFGARYDLPLPLWLYLAGAGAAVALSFVVLALFLRSDKAVWATPGLVLPFPERLGRTLLIAVQLAAVALFALVVIAGLIGNQNPTRNLAPTMIWVIWWVGLAFASALVGDIWRAINPLSAIFRAVQAARRRLAPGREFGLSLAYPNWLGIWPSVFLFLAFAWTEIVSDAGQIPAGLALLVLAYAALAWTGMFLFGQESWLRHGEVFSQAFSLMARFAPIETGRPASDGRLVWRLRPYATGLLTEKPVHPSMVAFTLALLSTVTFDGLVETPAWAGTLDWIATAEAPRPALVYLQRQGVDLLLLLKSLGLFTLYLSFVAAYLLFSAMMRSAAARAGESRSLAAVAGAFAFPLVPIAIAYHLAHYLSFLLLAGQLMIPLASDPFGFGWDLFATSHYRMDISIVSAKMVWYVAVSVIVVAHVMAVYLAHVMALRIFRTAKAAFVSQLPMLVLMVLYTMTSLWILSQPIVEG